MRDLRGAVERFARELIVRERVRRDLARSGPPVIVYSSGKSGSSAIWHTLAAAGLSAHHVHSLTPRRVAVSKHEYRQTGRVPYRHVWVSEYLMRHPPTSIRPWKVITPIREPIGRDIAAHFQTARRKGIDEHPEPERVLDARSTSWFDAELLPALGIDVYQSPFDRGRGWQTYTSPAIDLLVIRQDAISSRVIGDFVGRDLPEMAMVNVGTDKDNGDEYRRYLDGARIPGPLVDEVYATRFARHFFTAAELGTLRARWTGGVAELD